MLSLTLMSLWSEFVSFARTVLKMVRPIRIGSDFTGLDTPYWAFRRLELPCRHVFACDCDPSSLKVLHFLQPEIIYTDVRERDVTLMPQVDLFTFGPPCQPYSRQGNRQRDGCEMGQLGVFSLAYILHHKPRLIIMEQVPDVMTSDFMALVCRSLRDAGYTLDVGILKSKDFGVPQTRERVYLVGLLQPETPFVFPPSVQCPPVSSFIDRLPQSEFKYMPDAGPQGGQTRVLNVVQHLEECANEGVNPFQSFVFITSGASQSRCNHMVDCCMTITRTEGERQSIWCTGKGGFLEPHELAMLQGFPDGFLDWKSLGIRQSKFGALIGNAMTLNVLLHLIPNMLRAAGSLTEAEYSIVIQKARAHHPRVRLE